MKVKMVLFTVSILLLILTPKLHTQSFSNVAQQVGINVNYFDDHYVPGGGAGFADYDNDGDPDLIIAGKTGFKVFRNDNGYFTDVTGQSGIDFTGNGMKSVLWGDFDNDGLRDVFLTSWERGNRLYKNTGNGVFTNITGASGIVIPGHYQTVTAAWGDINRDGFIDLYVGNYGNIEGAGEQPNYLYKNNGNGTFTDITVSSGTKDSLYKKPLAIVMFDYDMDGWQDIYIAMDKYQRSTMFRNLGNETFEDVTFFTGTMCYFDAMGIAVGDYNHDGWLDMHVSNGPPGNATFRNNGDGTFTNVAVPTNSTVNKECWGVSFIDYDNDGWCDIYATASAGIDMCDVLLKNNHNNTFSNIGYGIGVSDSTFTYGTAKTDFNNDGYQDICATMSRDSMTYMYMSSGGSNNWIKLKCTGTQSNRDALGTVVTTYAGGVMNRQVILGGSSYLSSDDTELIFGIGSSDKADSIVIHWTNGQVDRSYNILKNGRYTAIEGSGVIGIQPISNEVPSAYYLFQNYPNPFNPVTKIRFAVPFKGYTELKVYDITGRLVQTLVNHEMQPGTYEADFDSKGLSSGVYFYRLTSGSFISTKKMILTK